MKVLSLPYTVTLYFIATTYGELGASDESTPNEIIRGPSDLIYEDGVISPNFACRFQCPIGVVQPRSTADVVSAVNSARNAHLPVVVRGGGHSYTCQSSQNGSLMIDMQYMRSISLAIKQANGQFSPLQSNGGSVQIPGADVPLYIEVGTGLTWGDVNAYLKQHGPHLRVVHGQCTSVGVAGFSLHGGVHFGGLSELYGLGSDNIAGLSAVLTNGSVVSLTESTCTVDGVLHPTHSKLCSDLWFGFRGAGSSFGVVTSLVVKVHRAPVIRSALSILSVSMKYPVRAQQVLSSYLKKLPQHVSVTLFGLDAYFKAYFFLIRFASEKLKAAAYDVLSLLPDARRNIGASQAHFIVEVSWVEDESVGISGGVDAVLAELQQVHDWLNELYTISYARDWLISPEMWSVPSYDAVWGKGHAYGGASITVDEEYAESAFEATLEAFAAHVQPDAKRCSDCVAVIHRIGDGLRTGGSLSHLHSSNDADSGLSSSGHCDTSNAGTSSEDEADAGIGSCSRTSSRSTSSFNPFLQNTNAALWIELDCGHFHRQRGSWPACSAFIDSAQREMDRSTPLEHKSHYPNVPSLVTHSWVDQYFGKAGYERLKEIKQTLDPYGMFSHLQGISIDDSSLLYKVAHSDEELTGNSSYAQSRARQRELQREETTALSSLAGVRIVSAEECTRMYNTAAYGMSHPRGLYKMMVEHVGKFHEFLGTTIDRMKTKAPSRP